MKVGELRGSSKGSGLQGREVIVRKIQIKQVFHSPKGTAFDFVYFAELQVKRDNLAGAWEAVGRKVVEVVAAEVKQLRLGGEASRDFGMTPTLTCGMLGFNLGRVKSEWNIINNTCCSGGQSIQMLYLKLGGSINKL